MALARHSQQTSVATKTGGVKKQKFSKLLVQVSLYINTRRCLPAETRPQSKSVLNHSVSLCNSFFLKLLSSIINVCRSTSRLLNITSSQTNKPTHVPRQISFSRSSSDDIHRSDGYRDIHRSDIHRSDIHRSDIHRSDIHRSDIHRSDIHRS